MTVFIQTLIWNTIIAGGILATIFILKNFLRNHKHLLNYIIAFTIWLLLGIIFLGFIPKSADHLQGIYIWIWILIGLFSFYILELFLHWHHCKDLDHSSSCHSSHSHEHKNGALMFWATMLHNSFHWVVLFAAFSVNFQFWLATTVALLLHAIPQNIANYIMNHNNIKFAYFAAIWGLLWAIITYPISDFLISKEWYIISIISWWLLYTALADIFPEFKWKWTAWKKISYLFFIIIWVIMFIWFENLIK